MHWRRPDPYCNGKTVTTPVRWHPCNLERKITPGVQLPIQRSVSTDIEELEYGVVKEEQSMTYYGYKDKYLSRFICFIITNPVQEGFII
jgi:hypothetical protein